MALAAPDVNPWNNEIGDFHPHARLLHGEDGIEDGLQMATAYLHIDIVAEGLEVDVGSIEIRQQVGQRFLTDIARRDEDVPESSLMRQPRTINNIFEIGQRLGISVGDAWTMVLLA